MKVSSWNSAERWVKEDMGEDMGEKEEWLERKREGDNVSLSKKNDGEKCEYYQI